MTRLEKYKELHLNTKLTDKKIMDLCVNHEVEPVTDEECESYPQRRGNKIALCIECWDKGTGGK